VLRQFAKNYGEAPKRPVPLREKEHPELDDSELVSDADKTQHQHIIGVCQWLVVAGRFDINYTVCSLSRFSIAPRHHHLELARELMGFLHKYPKKGYYINPSDPSTPQE